VPIFSKADPAALAFEESAMFDKREQLEKLEGVLLDGEEVLVPYREIVTIAAQDNDRIGRGFFASSVLTMTARNGQTYTFEFRTSEKAHAVHTMLLERIL
jgi:hypothetical protein